MKKDKYVDFVEVIHDSVELKSCSRSKQNYKKHLHHELSVGIIREGSTTVDFGDRTYIFREGDGIIIPPYMSHMCSPDNIEQWRFDMLYINPEFYKDFVDFGDVHKIEKSDSSIINQFIVNINSKDGDDVNEEKVVALLLSLDELTGKNNNVNIKNELVEEEKEYIEEHFNERLTLEMLEGQFGKTRYQIIRSFKKQYNTTPMAYQLQIKVSKAKQYIQEGMEVLDICDLLGFYDQAHFIREFKKMNGVTPKNYLDKISEH